MPLRIATWLLLLTTTPTAAQTALKVSVPVEADLEAGASHAYTLALDAGQFVAGEAHQQTVDVVITVTAPDGSQVDRVDGPARGPEPFQFETEAAGTYTLTVTPFEDGAGRYALLVRRAEAVATTPEGRVRQMMAGRDGENTPGAIVAVVRDGEIVYEEAFGMANLTHGVPYRLDTPTNIGSTSKQFTAFAVGLLAERGLLDLDDDVREYVPELPDLGETVTLRHLLTHTSGYREFLNTLVLSGRQLDEGDAVDRDEIIGVVQRQPRLQNPPGAEWNYNNTGYALLATVVERVTGEPFPEWMAANVFVPLGMDHTLVRASPTQIVPNSAQGYVNGPDGWREAADIGGAMGAGGIYTTVGDLGRWMSHLMAPKTHAEVVHQMTTRYVLADGDTTDYGLGLFVDEMDGQPRVQHGGADAAHRSAFGFFPRLGAGVIVLTNSPADADAMAGRTARAFFPEAFDAEADDDAPPASASAATDFDPEAFDAYAGRYALDEAPAFVLAFRRDGARYLIQPTNQPETEIAPTSDSTFASTIVDASVTFHRDADGRVRSLTLHQGGDHRAARLDVEPTAEAEPVDLDAYAGRYFSDELEAFYAVAVEDGTLVVRQRRADDERLQPAGADTFRTSGGVTLTFERGAAGAVTALTLDFGRTRDVRFERAD